MDNSISILLGAGFSAPMGYPTGNSLNEKLANLKTDKFVFSPDGSLAISEDGKKPRFWNKTTYDYDFEYCLELFKYYSDKKGSFDYEEFYDYLLDEAKKDKGAQKLAERYLDSREYFQLISGLKNIYNQLVSHFLKDSNDKAWYDDQPYKIGYKYSGYTGFLKYLNSIDDNDIVNIHTLNHDLFFESLNKTDFLANKLCDGFEELGSPYFGELVCNNRKYLCRLQCYTGNYNYKYRLYKLHGSLDYGIYYSDNKGSLKPERYIKTRYGIGLIDLYKEIKNQDGKLEYEKCWVNYHSDFLTGTTSKIERYEEPLLFKKLFKKFKKNLVNANKLIIVGYGTKDTMINQIIKDNYDFKNKPSYIVDPYAGENLESFAKEINAKIIKKNLEMIKNSDFE